jgi:hypothetical protein
MNFPADLRMRSDLMFFAGMTPGPHEPDFLEIANILEHIVPVFNKFLMEGRLIKTFKYPDGKIYRGGIGPKMGDRPAISKMTGGLGASAKYFCSWCWCTQEHRDSLDLAAFQGPLARTNAQVKDTVTNWRNAKTNKARSEIEKTTGIRWTPIHDLPSHRGVDDVVLGYMHNGLEGVAQDVLRDLYKIGERSATIVAFKKEQAQIQAARLAAVERRQKAAAAVPQDPSTSHVPSDSEQSGRSGATPLPSDSEQSSYNSTANSAVYTTEAESETSGNASHGSQATVLGNQDARTHVAALQDNDVPGTAAVSSYYKHLKAFSHVEIGIIHQAIRTIPLPTWVTRPPVNLGEASHGKLKAKDYQTLFSVIFPLILFEIWAARPQDSDFGGEDFSEVDDPAASAPAVPLDTDPGQSDAPEPSSSTGRGIKRKAADMTETATEIDDTQNPPKRQALGKSGGTKRAKKKGNVSAPNLSLQQKTPGTWTPDKWQANFHHLVASINIVAAYTTSDNEATAFEQHYLEFRKTLAHLYPKWVPKPNWHLAFHYGQQLRQFGPLGQLNEFSGEECIGKVQSLNTNWKIGKSLAVQQSCQKLTGQQQRSLIIHSWPHLVVRHV